MYKTITLNGTEFPRPIDFAPEIEDIYAGEIKTLSGKVLKDRVGWKYSDMSLSWADLPQDKVEALIGITGAVDFTFDDPSGIHTEQVARDSIVSMRRRYTIGGVYHWKDVSVKISFLEAH